LVGAPLVRVVGREAIVRVVEEQVVFVLLRIKHLPEDGFTLSFESDCAGRSPEDQSSHPTATSSIQRIEGGESLTNLSGSVPVHETCSRSLRGGAGIAQEKKLLQLGGIELSFEFLAGPLHAAGLIRPDQPPSPSRPGI